MGEPLNRAESQQQTRELQLLMHEALGCEYPEAGLVIRTDEPELFLDTINRARLRDPLLKNIIISIKSVGVFIYHDMSKERKHVEENGKPVDV